MEVSSDEDEITYDINADRNTKLMKSLENARAKAQVVVDSVEESASSMYSTARKSRQERMASYLNEDKSDDEDFASILQFKPTELKQDRKVERKRVEEASSPYYPEHSQLNTTPNAKHLHKNTLKVAATPAMRRLSLSKSPGKEKSRVSFEAAFDRPSHWLRTPTHIPSQRRKRPASSIPMTVVLPSQKAPSKTTPNRRSMSDVLRMATTGSAERHPQRATQKHPQDEIMDAGMGFTMEPSGIQSPQAIPFVMPPKEKRRKRLSEIHIVGEIGQVIQRAARKSSRDSTLLNTLSHQSLHQSTVDSPLNRPYLSLCILRTRIHHAFAIFSCFVHSVSDEEYFRGISPRPPLLPIQPNVFVDAVFPKESLIHLTDRILLQIYPPFHFLTLDGPYPFPLLLGTHLYQVIDKAHQCSTTLTE